MIFLSIVVHTQTVLGKILPIYNENFLYEVTYNWQKIWKTWKNFHIDENSKRRQKIFSYSESEKKKCKIIS